VVAVVAADLVVAVLLVVLVVLVVVRLVSQAQPSVLQAVVRQEHLVLVEQLAQGECVLVLQEVPLLVVAVELINSFLGVNQVTAVVLGWLPVVVAVDHSLWFSTLQILAAAAAELAILVVAVDLLAQETVRVALVVAVDLVTRLADAQG
jgi:hypothetical protein